MKRLVMLAVLCAFVLGASVAQAADIKASGVFVAEALWMDNWNFDQDGAADTSSAYEVRQRAQVAFEFIANENLKGLLQVRYTGRWGEAGMMIGNGDNNGAARNDLAVRQAYLDFNWPGTAVNAKIGFQGVTLPNAIGGSMILSEEIAAAVVSGAITDNVSYLGAYTRAATQNNGDNMTDGELDVYVVALPLSFDGIAAAPFFAYGVAGENFATLLGGAAGLADTGDGTADGLISLNPGNTDDTSAWWLGSSFEMTMFDPFVLKADLNYGAVEADLEQDERSGWMGALALEYTGLDFMTPEVYFVYTSGEDDDVTNGSERMATIAPDWAVGSFFFGGSFFMGDVSSDQSQSGFWTMGTSLKDIKSFADGLSHTVNILYVQGTNDEDSRTGATNASAIQYGRYLTEEDSLWEVDFNTTYQIYEELTLSVELGYMNLDADEDVWGNDAGGDAYKLATGLAYEF